MAVRSFGEMESLIDNFIKKSQPDFADLLEEKLRNYIDEEFYITYDPKKYKRTSEFLNSPVSDIDNREIEVGLSENYLKYRYPSEEDLTPPNKRTGLESTNRALGYTVAANAKKNIHGSDYAVVIDKNTNYWDQFLFYFLGFEEDYALDDYLEILKSHGMKVNYK